VDNQSRDETGTQLPQQFPWVRFIASPENLGFTAGNNLAYAHASGEFVYFLNPDTELCAADPARGSSEDSLWALYNWMARDETIGLAGPLLLNSDGTVQSSRRRFPTRWSDFLNGPRFGQLILGRCNQVYKLDYWPHTFAHDVDWVTGAAMLARRSALEQIRQPEYQGPFDESFFMYSEEIDLCRRLKLQGWRISFVPQAVVIHHYGKSSEQMVLARTLRYHRSRIRYFRKYFGPAWAELLRHYTLLEFRFMLWEERAKWWLGHKRALRAERIDQYRQILADGLYLTNS
jgi:N-acetylglucosaminyl-diphospho-decaprenol L-rhamnosyltransferase